MTDDEVRLERRRRRRQAVVSCGKRVVAFLFSHVGLAAMVVAYSILGGFLFRALEAPYERELKVGEPLPMRLPPPWTMCRSLSVCLSVC